MSVKFNEIRVRIAPSPTGQLHIGTARTSLFNYLFAKREKGKFILRIEDTDQERSDIRFEKDIINNLNWLNIKWDEGPNGGEYGPYEQSKRKGYTKYLEKLLKENKAYYCFCSEEELEEMRQEQMSRGEPPCYNKKCRGLSPEEVKKYLEEEKRFVIRFKILAKKVIFHDLIRGELKFDPSLIGDFVIAKNMATPLYNFAVVIDDFEMKISHVIRGEDHISNTPKQILLQEALDFPQPEYAHLPLILGPDRTKLSKRHGTVAISEYRKHGYLPEALVNFIAFLGWNPGTEREIYSMTSLIKEFSLNRCQKGGAIFNIKRLDYLNGFYIRQKPIKKLVKLCQPYLPKAEPAYIEKIVAIYQERLKKLSEITELTLFFFKDVLEYNKEFLRWKDMPDKEIKMSLDKLEKILSKIDKAEWIKENLEKILMSNTEIVVDKGRFLWPLRVALTGMEASAGPFEIAEILGKEKTLARIKHARELIK